MGVRASSPTIRKQRPSFGSKVFRMSYNDEKKRRQHFSHITFIPQGILVVLCCALLNMEVVISNRQFDKITFLCVCSDMYSSTSFGRHAL